jgi:hypothetical protein
MVTETAPPPSSDEGGWFLGNGSRFVMPSFHNLPGFNYANLRDQLTDAQSVYTRGAGGFANNAAPRYAFAKGLLGGGTTPPPPAGGGGGGIPPPPGGSLLNPPGVSPPSRPPRPVAPPGGPPVGGGTYPPGAGPVSRPPPGAGGPPPPAPYTAPPAPAGVPFPGWGDNWGATPKATPEQFQALSVARKGNQAPLLGLFNGNVAAMNRMINAHAAGGQHFDAQANADADRGESGGISTLMPGIRSIYEKQGYIANGKWVKKQDVNGNWIPV